VFKDKREAMEAFKELLREKNVPSTANWSVNIAQNLMGDVPSEFSAWRLAVLLQSTLIA
jgi:hypothetical protein